jgi:hypothetical protein
MHYFIAIGNESQIDIDIVGLERNLNLLFIRQRPKSRGSGRSGENNLSG